MASGFWPYPPDTIKPVGRKNDMNGSGAFVLHYSRIGVFEVDNILKTFWKAGPIFGALISISFCDEYVLIWNDSHIELRLMNRFFWLTSCPGDQHSQRQCSLGEYRIFGRSQWWVYGGLIDRNNDMQWFLSLSYIFWMGDRVSLETVCFSFEL